MEAMAGPGGAIAKGLFTTFWGKLFLVLLVIIFLPLIIVSVIRGRIKQARTRKALNQLATQSRLFDSISLNTRMRDIFERVYLSWNKGDLDDTSEWMNSWYRQNQQIVHLNNWNEKGLKNYCEIGKIFSIIPIHIQMNRIGDSLNGTRVVFKIHAEVIDYLEEVSTGRLVKGEYGFVNNSNLWTLELTDRNWKLDNIEETEMLQVYEKLKNVLVPISQTARNTSGERSVIEH
jgi:hypothetical protein